MIRYAERSSARGTAAGLTLDLAARPAAGPAHLLEQRLERSQAGLRGEIDVIRLAPHGAQEPAHLGQRGAPGALDVLERLLVGGQLVGKPVPHSSDVQHHDAHRVRDDVVQLTRDPRPFFRHGDPRERLALPFGARGARLGSVGLARRGRAARARPSRRSRTAPAGR